MRNEEKKMLVDAKKTEERKRIGNYFDGCIVFLMVMSSRIGLCKLLGNEIAYR